MRDLPFSLLFPLGVFVGTRLVVWRALQCGLWRWSFGLLELDSLLSWLRLHGVLPEATLAVLAVPGYSEQTVQTHLHGT